MSPKPSLIKSPYLDPEALTSDRVPGRRHLPQTAPKFADYAVCASSCPQRKIRVVCPWHLPVADLRKVPAILVDLVIYDKHFTLGYASKGLATVGRFLTLEMSLSGNIMRRLVSREYCNWSFPVRFCGQC